MNSKYLIIISFVLWITSCEYKTEGNELLDLKRPIPVFTIQSANSEITQYSLDRNNEDFRIFSHNKKQIELVAWSKEATQQDPAYYHTGHVLILQSKNEAFLNQFTKIEFEYDYNINVSNQRHTLLDIFSTTIYWKYDNESDLEYREIYDRDLTSLTDEVRPIKFQIIMVLRSGITSLLNNEHHENRATYTFDKINIVGKFD